MIVQRIACPANGATPTRDFEGEGVSLFHRIVVVLDRLAPHQGAFSLATDWVRQLHLPLIGMASGQCEQGMACAEACARLHVPFNMIQRKEREATDLPLVAGPTDLLVLGHALTAPQKKNLLRAAMGDSSPAILVCPDAYASVHRILLLDQGIQDLSRSLPVVASLCRAFGAKLVVLTVSHTEKESHRRQQTVRSSLASIGLHADCDSVIGSEVRVAAVGVARWRRCQLVVMSREVSPPWWRWLRDSSPEWFMSLTQPLAFLALPETESTTRATESAGGAPMVRMSRSTPRSATTLSETRLRPDAPHDSLG
jgi:hypothetical protein